MKKNRNDLILIICLFVVFACSILIMFLTRTKENLMVNIYLDNVLVESIDISEDKQIEINNVLIVIENNEVYVSSSTCEDKICMNLGKISYSGQTITCLPNRVLIKIEGNKVDIGI